MDEFLLSSMRGVLSLLFYLAKMALWPFEKGLRIFCATMPQSKLWLLPPPYMAFILNLRNAATRAPSLGNCPALS